MIRISLASLFFVFSLMPARLALCELNCEGANWYPNRRCTPAHIFDFSPPSQNSCGSTTGDPANPCSTPGGCFVTQTPFPGDCTIADETDNCTGPCTGGSIDYAEKEAICEVEQGSCGCTVRETGIVYTEDGLLDCVGHVVSNDVVIGHARQLFLS